MGTVDGGLGEKVIIFLLCNFSWWNLISFMTYLIIFSEENALYYIRCLTLSTQDDCIFCAD